MVEALRISVERLEPLECPACQTAMVWYRAEKQDADTISHYFVCERCGKIGIAKTCIHTKRRLSVPPHFLHPSSK